ncbi:MAG: signal peptidase II [Lachnospiraceae bacterium]|nr:signal peptidase II [Lachnospiraceae bacterium]
MLIYFGIIAGILFLEMVIKHEVIRREEKGDKKQPKCKGIRIEHLENGGAASGIFSEHKTVLKIVTGGILTVLCFCLGKEYRRKSFSAYGLGLTLVLGGGLSNWIDRLRKGTVTDYVRFSKCPVKALRKLVFNISDFCILIGGILLFLMENLSIKKGN